MRVVVDGVVAWLAVAGGEIDGGVGAEEVVDYEVEVFWAGRDVVVVEVVVGAHFVRLYYFFSSKSRRPLYPASLPIS